MDESFFPLPQLHDLALQVLPRAARGYADVVAALAFALLIGLLIRLLVFPLLARAASRNQWPYDDIAVAILRRRVLPWVVLATLYAELEELPWRARSIATAEKVLATLLVASVTFTLIRIVSAVVGRAQTANAGGTTLVKYIINALLFMLGVGAVLAFFGVSVFPALTALGVGGLAVALAFQDTLANVFAGVNLTASRQIRVGDYIEIEGGIEGFIDDIGWRTTTIRALENVVYYVPNKKLSEVAMTNFSRPDPSMSIELRFRVGFDADPERVEAIVVDEVARARAAIAGLRPDPPIIRLREFGASGLEFRAFVAIENFVDRFALTHALMKRMFVRLRAEGLAIPYPQTVVHMAGQ